MSQHQAAQDVVVAGAKLAPAAAVVATDAAARQFLGVGLQDWVYILTLAYLLFQIVVILPRVKSTIKGWFKRDAS